MGLSFLIYFLIGAAMCYFTRKKVLNKVLEENKFPPALVISVVIIFWFPLVAVNVFKQIKEGIEEGLK